MSAQSQRRATEHTSPSLSPSSPGASRGPAPLALGPLGALAAQGTMGNGALGDMLAGSADPGRIFDAGMGGARGALPFRGQMERSFGGSLGDIDVRQGAVVDAALGGLGAAAAYQDGQMLLGQGATPEIVAHEVAHAQQEKQFGRGGLAKKSLDGGGGDRAEKDADQAAKAAISGRPAMVSEAPTAGIHRFGVGKWIGKAWDGAKKGVGTVWDGVKAGANITLNAAGEHAGNVWDTLKTGAGNTWDSVKAGAGDVWDTAKTGVGDTWNALSSGASGTWDAMKGGASGAWDAGKGWLGSSWDALSSGDLSGAWDNFTSGAGNTWDAVKGGAGNTWDALSSGAGTLWDTGKGAVGSTWDAVTSGAGNVWNTGSDAVGDTWDAAKHGVGATWSELQKNYLEWEDEHLYYQGSNKLTGPETLGKVPPNPDILYETASLSSTANAYTGALDAPATNDGGHTQNYSALGLPLTTDAWERQNKIDGGKLRRLHDETLLGTLQEAGLLDDLVQSGALKDGEIPTDFSEMDAEDLSAVVNQLDDTETVRTFFANMNSEDFTKYQTGIIDSYIEMANKDPSNAAFLLDTLPTDLGVGFKPSEIASGQANNFHAGDDVSAFREGSVEMAEMFQEQGKDTYGLVVPYANTAENIVNTQGQPQDLVDNLSNYLGQIDGDVTTSAMGYSQSGAGVLDYAQQYGGSQGLDYVLAIAAMGGADGKGADGVWSGTIHGSNGEDTQGVKTLSVMNEGDPAKYIHNDNGLDYFGWSLANFALGNDGWQGALKKGDGDLHGGYDDPADGTYGYPMDGVIPLFQDLATSEDPGSFERKSDWDVDTRERQGAVS